MLPQVSIFKLAHSLTTWMSCQTALLLACVTTLPTIVSRIVSSWKSAMWHSAPELEIHADVSVWSTHTSPKKRNFQTLPYLLWNSKTGTMNGTCGLPCNGGHQHVQRAADTGRSTCVQVPCTISDRWEVGNRLESWEGSTTLCTEVRIC